MLHLTLLTLRLAVSSLTLPGLLYQQQVYGPGSEGLFVFECFYSGLSIAAEGSEIMVGHDSANTIYGALSGLVVTIFNSCLNCSLRKHILTVMSTDTYCLWLKCVSLVLFNVLQQNSN